MNVHINKPVSGYNEQTYSTLRPAMKENTDLRLREDCSNERYNRDYMNYR